MRLLTSLIMLSLLTLFATVPAEARPSPVCASELSATCPGYACADNDLDGKFEWDECVQLVCPTWGCCSFDCQDPAVPASGGSATCTGYMNVLGSKQRTCVDPSNAPECGAWTEGWSTLGYYRACYGTGPLDVYGCVDRICIV